MYMYTVRKDSTFFVTDNQSWAPDTFFCIRYPIFRYFNTSIGYRYSDTFQNFVVRYAIFDIDTFLNNCAVGLKRNPLFKFHEKQKKGKSAILIRFIKICMKGYSEAVEPDVFTSVAEPEPQGAASFGRSRSCNVMRLWLRRLRRSSSDSTGSDNGIKHFFP
jgi:hypothetical protein